VKDEPDGKRAEVPALVVLECRSCLSSTEDGVESLRLPELRRNRSC
jgi:hypothetical protein